MFDDVKTPDSNTPLSQLLESASGSPGTSGTSLGYSTRENEMKTNAQGGVINPSGQVEDIFSSVEKSGTRSGVQVIAGEKPFKMSSGRSEETQRPSSRLESVVSQAPGESFGSHVASASDTRSTASVFTPRGVKTINESSSSSAMKKSGGFQSRRYFMIGILTIAVIGGGYLVYSSFLKPSVVGPDVVSDVNDEQGSADGDSTNQGNVSQGTANGGSGNDGNINSGNLQNGNTGMSTTTGQGTVGNNQTSTTIDSDGDKVSDEDEVLFGSDKNLTDTDSDGLDDYQEIFIYKTNPRNPDSDGDTYLDGEEVNHGFDPTVPLPGGNRGGLPVGSDSATDTDGDGLSLAQEEFYGTDPENSDTDADGYSDGAEVNGGYNPKGPGML